MAADLSEFATKLKQQGSTLCLPLGKSLTAALKRYGFRPGQDVVVRFGHERLQVLARNTPEEVREKLRLAAGDLRQFEVRMRDLLGQLPVVSDEALEAEESLEGELQGLLECLLADDLAPAIEKLESVKEIGRPAEPAPAGHGASSTKRGR